MIGDRIKEERRRLGLNQTDFAALAGAAKRTQIDWEKGVSAPTAEQLAAIAAAGADIQYIVTGVRQGDGIGPSAVHQAVLQAVHILSIEKKVDAQQLANAVVICAKQHAEMRPSFQSGNGGAAQQFNAPVLGDVAGRNIVNKGRKKKNEAGVQ